MVAALRARAAASGRELEIFGIGGPALRAEGLRALARAEDLRAMGLTEALVALRRIRAAFRALLAEAERVRPDAALLADYPEFHLRLATRLRARGVRTIDWIPPKLWVWRAGRARRLREAFDRVLTILPFEEEFLRGLGVEAHFTGNPLAEAWDAVPPRDEVRRDRGVPDDALVWAMLPGSRPAELREHFAAFVSGIEVAAERLARGGRIAADRPLRVWVPATGVEDAARFAAGVEAAAARSRATGAPIAWLASEGDARAVLRAADLGLVKSGTATLEAALAGLPHVAAYRVSRTTAWVYRHFVGYAGPVALSNLLTAPGAFRARPPFLVPEVTLADVTPARLARELLALDGDASARASQKAAFAGLRARLAPRRGVSAAACAAEAIWEILPP